MSGISVSRLVRLFLADVAATVSPSTLAVYTHYANRFADRFGSRSAAGLTPAIVRAWSHTYHALGVVRRVYRWAVVEARLIAVNPLEGMRAPRNDHRRRVLSRGELIRLLRSARPCFRRFVLAMSLTIGRPREIRSVRWGDLRCNGSPAWSSEDLRAGRCYFMLTRFKSRELRRDRHALRIIPVPPRLGRMLARLATPGFNPADAIFRNSDSSAWSCNAVRLQMRRLRDRAGLVADVNGESIVAYSLRHTAATEAVGAGIKTMTLAELMGHSDIRMTQRYCHLRPDHLVEATRTIAEFKATRRTRPASGQ